MRKAFLFALTASVLCAAAVTGDAAATVTIDLEWGACGGGTGGCSGLGTSELSVSPGGGHALRLDIFLSHDESGGLVAHVISIRFDIDLLNELNLGAMAGVNWAGTDVDPNAAVTTYEPIALFPPPPVESTTGGVAGQVNFFESGVLTLSLPVNGAAYTVGTTTATAPARYRIGQVFFVANEAINDGADVFSGFFNAGLDGALDSAGNLIPISHLSFGVASLNLIPEPGTVLLLGLGLVGLVLAGRASRR